MPLHTLAARDRTATANWRLAGVLAFAAGAVDVSGFLRLHQFTSHMSGIVATLAADLENHGANLLVQPALVLGSFLTGAAVCALMVNWSRQRNHHSIFALPVLLEATLLAFVALVAATHGLVMALCLLSFSMGLQNAIMTKVSHAEIRTTHITGMVTDIGIELGKALYWNRTTRAEPVHSNHQRLLLLTMLVLSFFCGGAYGALTYPHLGLLLILFPAAVLATLTVLPIAADLRTLSTTS